MDINPHIRGCIVTGGMDKTLKVWNISDEETEGVKGRKRDVTLVTSRDLGLVRLSQALILLRHDLTSRAGKSFHGSMVA